MTYCFLTQFLYIWVKTCSCSVNLLKLGSSLSILQRRKLYLVVMDRLLSLLDIGVFICSKERIKVVSISCAKEYDNTIDFWKEKSKSGLNGSGSKLFLTKGMTYCFLTHFLYNYLGQNLQLQCEPFEIWLLIINPSILSIQEIQQFLFQLFQRAKAEIFGLLAFINSIR